MLSGSALFRVVILVVAAAVLAAFVQALWPSSGVETASDTRVVPATPERRNAQPIQEPPPPAPAPVQPLVPTETPPSPVPPPAQTTPQVVEAPPRMEAQPMPREDAASAAADSSGPRALSVVDLNTGTLAELNRLQGGGSIGRAIVRSRPYTSVDQLLSKRVLSKATYQRIKDQVTVR